jgi:protein-S-isoprenylcysteine O-methyltransferase Ste14
MTRGTADIAIGGALAVRWVHLAVTLRRGKDTPRPPADGTCGTPEWQVLGLGVAYLMALVLWLYDSLGSWQAPTDLAHGVAAVSVVAGACLRIIGQHALGPAFSWGSSIAPPQLVTSGIYRVLKHPLLLGYALECGGLLVGIRGDLMLRAGTAGLLVVSLCAQVVREERTLARRFGREWAEYAHGKLL